MSLLSIIPVTDHRVVTYPVTNYKVVTYPVTETVTRENILFEGKNLIISEFGYRYSGPYDFKAGQTITVTWDADSVVNVYIMNDVDWSKRFFGAPTSWRAFRSGTSGSLSYTLRYDEPIYIQVMSPTWSSAKLYTWKETRTWQEQTTTYTTQTIAITTYVNETITEQKYKSLISILYETLLNKH